MIPYYTEPAARADVRHLVESHYLGKWPGVVTGIFGLLNECKTRYIGVIVFALPPRETMKRYGVTLAWELARLFIEDGTPKNTESWFISKALAWVKKTRQDVQAVVSYADPSAGHSGTIYRAANWISDGMTDDERKTPRFDYLVNGRKYSRRSHVPEGAEIGKVARVSKPRFVYWMKNHEKRRRALA